MRIRIELLPSVTYLTVLVFIVYTVTLWLDVLVAVLIVAVMQVTCNYHCKTYMNEKCTKSVARNFKTLSFCSEYWASAHTITVASQTRAIKSQNMV